jgi:hypothetical protein
MLLAATVLAERRSRPAVRLYFRAQIIATVALFAGVRLLGVHQMLYAVLYIAVTLPILETCGFLIAEGHPGERTLLVAACFGLLMGCIAASDVGHHTLGDYIVFFEGVLLAEVGIAMLVVGKDIAVETIGTLSLALSSFDFVYLMNPEWESANGWIPSFLATMAFIRIGFGRQEREA